MLPVLDKPEFEIGIDILLSSTVILRFFESISCAWITNHYLQRKRITIG